MTAPRPLDVERVREALSLVEAGSLDEAAALLAPLVSKRRLTRSSGRVAEPLELTEIEGYLRSALEDPGADDARFFVERAYYKLRRHRPAG